MMDIDLHNGDCLGVLKAMDENSVDSIVTDPPYGLSAAKNSGKTSASGFMGNTWDYDVPRQEIFEECLRVLKPGGHILSFSSTRTYHRMAVRIEDAGFEIRNLISWNFGSGFPKSQNISKAIDKKLGHEQEVVFEGRAVKRMIPGADQDKTGSWIKDNGREYVPTVTKASSDEAQQFVGWGTNLKPAMEPICMARKPLIGTVVENVLEYGTGGINIDESRVGPVNLSGERKTTNRKPRNDENVWTNDNSGMKPTIYADADPKGRFPSNVILSHHPDCECIGVKKIKNKSGSITGNEPSHTEGENATCYGEYGRIAMQKYGDEDGNETVEEYNCHPGCPVRIMDEQSGVLSSGKDINPTTADVSSFFGNKEQYYNSNANYGDKGGASRFFYCAKTSKSERNHGLDAFEEVVNSKFDGGDFERSEGNIANHQMSRNPHPTVKPIKLMIYLQRMVTPKNGITLDPFMGSGSSGLAAKLGGFKFIGIELDEQYFQIAKARIASSDDFDLSADGEVNIVERERNTFNELFE